jgi:hypothetical protein
MQVLSYYFLRWVKQGDELVDEDGIEAGNKIDSKHRGGAEKGQEAKGG